MKQNVETDNDMYIFDCPHCNEKIVVMRNETACCIFRHGVYKNTMKQIPPHSPKSHCDEIFEKKLIHGCGKPFKFFHTKPPYVEECDYI